MKKITLILAVLALILIIIVSFLGYKYSTLQKELELLESDLKVRQVNEKVLDFTKFFIEKVLQAELEVDFETRLLLENKVRNLDDPEVLAKWNIFVESKTEEDAQKNVKNFLESLVNKLEVN